MWESVFLLDISTPPKNPFSGIPVIIRARHRDRAEIMELKALSSTHK
jgi:hypothetical protein